MLYEAEESDDCSVSKFLFRVMFSTSPLTKIKHLKNKSIRLAKAQICDVFLHSQINAFIRAALISVHCNMS